MNYKDYYKVLGVKKSAAKDEIKKAYRSLARKYHPDVNADDPAAAKRFKEIGEAYEVLGNEENRKLYDQLGAQWKNYKRSGGSSSDFNWQQWARSQRGGGPGAGFGSGAGQAGSAGAGYRTAADFFGGGDFSDFFEQIFGGGMSRGYQRQQRNRPGSGFREQAYDWGGRMSAEKGKDINAELAITLEEAWHGVEKNVRVKQKPIKIKIPAGIRSGRRLKLRERGHPGKNGGPAGDLYIKIDIKPHPVFSREEDDLYTNVDVSLYHLLLGGVVRVPTITGSVKIKVPPESQAGKVMRVAGHGMPVFQQEGKRGDLYVTLQALLPEKLTSREKELFKQLADIRGEKTAG